MTCQWQDSTDGMESHLREGSLPIGRVWRLGETWSAAFRGEPLPLLFGSKTSAQIGVANARGRAKMPGRVLYREVAR